MPVRENPYSGISYAVINEVYVLINVVRSVSDEILPYKLILLKMARRIFGINLEICNYEAKIEQCRLTHLPKNNE